MPIGEVIFGTIGELFGYIVIDLIIEGIGKLFRGGYYGIRKLLTGKERDIPELKRIEKRYLYKKFKLKSDFSDKILKGTRGTVVEIINKKDLYVEFETSDGKPVIVDNEQTFIIERKRIILEKIKTI